MTQEEKQLLLKDLLGRVLYGVKVDYHSNIFTLGYSLYLNKGDVAFENYPMLYFLENIESVKPYLRPISSMTEKEKKEYYATGNVIWDYDTYSEPIIDVFEMTYKTFDWLNKKGFDYRGLIPMGLALEAPEDMYKTE